MKIDPSPELVRRFQKTEPTPEQVASMDEIQAKALELGSLIEANVPAGPERAHAITMLQTATMWANSGITRPQTAVPRELSR